MENFAEGKAIDFKRLLLALWKRAGLIAICGFLVASIAFSYLYFFVTPIYGARTKMYVNNIILDTPYVSASQITAARELAETYIVILKSRDVLAEVKDVSGLNYSVSQIASMVSAKRIDSTEAFQVTVMCANLKHAVILADAVAQVLPGQLEEAITGSKVSVFENANGSAVPVNRNFTETTLFGAAIGMGIAAMIIVLFELIDTKIRSEDVLLNEYKDIPLLAVVPGETSVRYGNYKYYKRHYRSNYQQADTPSEGTEDGGDAQ